MLPGELNAFFQYIEETVFRSRRISNIATYSFSFIFSKTFSTSHPGLCRLCLRPPCPRGSLCPLGHLELSWWNGAVLSNPSDYSKFVNSEFAQVDPLWILLFLFLAAAWPWDRQKTFVNEKRRFSACGLSSLKWLHFTVCNSSHMLTGTPALTLIQWHAKSNNHNDNKIATTRETSSWSSSWSSSSSSSSLITTHSLSY